MQDLFVLALEAIYAAAPEPSLWPQALQAIADVFGDVGTVLVYGRDDGGFGAIASPGVEEMVQEFGRLFQGQDLRSIRGRERGLFLQQDAVTDRHVVSDEEMETHPFYAMMARHHLKYFAGVPVSPDPRVNVAISVQRALDKPPYADQELELLSKLGRHAEKSLRLSIRLLDAELTNVGFGEALARIGISAFAVDSLKRVVYANPAAERLVGNGIGVLSGRLVTDSPSDQSRLNEALERMIRSAPEDLARDPRPLLIHRHQAERPLALYVLPVPAGSPVTQFLTHTRAIVLAIDPSEAGAPADPAIVRDLLGLTLGEARVAALIGSGLPPREAAEKLGIAEETARTALKRVFAKAGVSRQSELTALLSKLVLR